MSDLETNGIVVLPNILTPDQLRGMQQVCKRILAPAQILSRPARCREKCCIAEVLMSPARSVCSADPAASLPT